MLLFLLIIVQAEALDPSRSVYQYNCRSWVRQSGLPANGVYAIAQSVDGYLWLGSSRGLVRFDGNEFKLFDLSQVPGVRSTIITSIANARNGGLWFGMERGSFGFFDGGNITLLGRDEWGGRSMLVQSILESRNGDVWIASERLAARLTDTNTFQLVLQDTGNNRYDVTAMHQDSTGRVWLGTSQRGVYFWQNGQLTKFPDPRLDEFNIRSMVVDQQGQIWIGTEWGLFRYDAEFNRLPFPHPWYETKALLADRRGVIWAGTSGGGICRILNGTNLIQLRKVDGLADDFVSALIEDQEGSLWVGTRNGLSQISDVKIPTFGKKEELTADVNVGVYPSSKTGFWVATGQGFTYFDGIRARTYGTNVGLRNTYIMEVLEARDGDIYLVTGGKDVEVFSRDRIVARHANRIWPSAMAEDARSVVVAVGGELYRAGTNFYEPYVFDEGQKPQLNWIHSMASGRDGSIWVGGDVGLCQVKEGTCRVWGQKEGLPNSKVLWVCEDEDGTVWAGLETGIARLKNGRIRVITAENGLFDNINYTLIPDDHGSLWVDSSRGFYSVTRQGLNDFADGKRGYVRCAGYDGLDAIKSSEKYQQQRSGCKTPDGRIWFPTAEGIVMIDPPNLPANPVPPKIHIHQVVANEEELGRTGQAVVAPGNGNLEFHYAGLSYIAPLKIQYRYRLSGYDKDWVDAGTRRAAFYTNLKPGRYEFEVQACNEDGVWSTSRARYAIELRPHYYQALWFYALCGLAAVAVLALIYSWRFRHLRQRERALEQSRLLLEVKVAQRTAALAESNASLVMEVEERIKTQGELEGRKAALEKEIEERRRVQLEVERIHRQLVAASREAGQAEVASSVLHNVGNVLNSVNVSAAIVSDRVSRMQIANIAKAVRLMREHQADLARFLTADERGRKLPDYLEKLAEHLGLEQDSLLAELRELTGNVDHIKQIVAMQQNYAKVSGMAEKASAAELVDNALKMQAASYHNHGVSVQHEYEPVPEVVVDRHKALQILINIFQNARLACEESGKTEKRVVARIRSRGPDRVAIEIQDNGVGIAPANLTRIFSHGFTTRKHGHGFGLHSAALAAREMGGILRAQSDGLGRGASFILELPLQPPSHHPTDTLPGLPSPATGEQGSQGEIGLRSDLAARQAQE